MPLILTQKLTLKQTLPYIFLVAAIIGGLASFALTYDKLHVLNDPAYQPACNINPILSCGSVMKTEQATLLGLPNTIFGIMGFSMLGTIGIALLAGAKFKRWLWNAINFGVLAGFSFSIYLFFQGVYRINAICPYCFIIWMVLPPVLWYTTLYNLREGNLKLSFIKPKVRSWLLRHHGDVLIVWYFLIFGLLLTHFWYYWKALL
ncbi:MAG TPA: vitamin K epoxide reductase family protein [Candidatus Saccharimonadales bacterium]|nr:vitamin K epoxide reductase family protein [Candidatus Saccharimonadales bacterium]